MPKRKRPDYSDPTTRLKADTLEKIQHTQKLLQRALKTAKGFERQKLGKRLKAAQAKGGDGVAEVGRINKEIEALKTLELRNMAETYLAGKIMKIKKMAESEVLPEEVRLAAEKKGKGSDISEELKNVMSGMYNLKVVKEAVDEGLRGLYLAMGIPLPTTTNGKKAVPTKGILKKTNEDIMEGQKLNVDTVDLSEARSGSWSGFESEEGEGEELADIPRSIEQEPDLDIDSDPELGDLSQYETRLASSDTDSDADGESSSESDSSDSNTKATTKPKPRHSRSLSSSSISPSPTRSPSPPPTKRSKPSASSKAPAAPPKQTTFLPTLYGGYFSGSESASDIDDARPVQPVRKNRPGQMARRAIAEKKFGTGANHIKKGQPRVAEMGKAGREKGKGGKDDGWDARKGAKESTGSRFGRDRGSGFRGTGDNAIPQGEGGGKFGGKRGMGKKDDAGPLHPSWQAAKKAKDEKKSAQFTGKKVVFD
ncbi:Bud-site selection protein [Halenospora varia]|nr:Bud-site selection protein [Halenospora varia]